MSYTRPDYDSADASWVGASTYTRPDYDAADAAFASTAVIDVPVCAFDLEPQIPVVLAIDPVNISVPSLEFTFTTHAPTLNATVVEIPSVAFTLTAYPPGLDALVDVPSITFTFTAYPPGFPVYANIPSVAFTLAASAPVIEAEDSQVRLPAPVDFTLRAYPPRITRGIRWKVSESTQIGDASINRAGKISIAQDTHALSDSAPCAVRGVLVEAIEAGSAFVARLQATDTRAEAFGLEDRGTLAFPWSATDGARLSETAIQRGRAGWTLTDQMALAETPAWHVRSALVEALGLTETVQALTRAVAVFNETLAVGDDYALAIQRASLETLNLDDAALRAAQMVLSESFDLTTYPREALRTLFGDTFAVTEQATAAFVSVGAETLTIADAPRFTLFGLMVGREGIAFHLTLTLDDGDYELWAFNAKTLGATRYTGVQFNSLASFNGRTFGVNETGLYALEGSTDDGDPIDSYFETGMIAFGSPMQEKRNRRVYLYGESSDTVILKVFADTRNGCREEAAYRLEADLGDSTLGARTTKIGGGLRGTHWKFRVENLSGATLDVRGMEVLPANFTYKP